MTSTPRRVLIVTYAFPPVAYVGVYRTLKYCKYLAQYGWSAVVLTARPHRSAHQDANLTRQIPADVEVYRTLDFDPVRWIDRLAPPRPAPRAAPVKPAESGSQPATMARPGLFDRFKKFVLALLTQSPDSHLFWVPFAFIAGAWIMLTRRIEVVYCSSPPHSSHVVAYLLAKCFRKPLVLDFRDPWYVTGSVRTPAAKNGSLLRAETGAKRAAVSRAARIVSATRGERDEFAAEYPQLDAARFEYITNGYDPSDFTALTPAPPSTPERVSLIHAGTLYGGIAHELFAALHALAGRHPDAARRVVVHLVGEVAEEYMGDARALESLGLVRLWGLQPHARTLALTAGSDVLLILLGGSRFRASHLPAKVFEYLHVGKPILAIAQPGELSDIVTRSGLGLVLSPDSVDAIVDTLRGLAEPGAADRLASRADVDYIRSFERTALTARLASILDAAATQRRGN